MMANTFTKIAAVTVGSGGASTIDFTSIPSTYTDLCVKVSARGDLTQVYDSLYFQLNGLTTSIYTRLTISASGSGTPGSGSSTSTQMFFGAAAGNSATANTFGSSELYFPNYAGSANKSTSSESVQETNATTAYMYVHAGLTATTAAITSIKLLIESNKFLQYSTATLYGINKS